MSVILTACRLTTPEGNVPSASEIHRKLLMLEAAGMPHREGERLRLMRRDEARLESVGARLALLFALSGQEGALEFGQIATNEMLLLRPLSAFGKTPEGVPCLLGDGRAISMSHCKKMAVAAVADGGRIGVDVESLDRRLATPVNALAEHFFSQGERELFAADGEDLQAFLRIWTRKEALGKARREGLRYIDTLDTAALPPETFTQWEVDGCVVSVCVLKDE